MVRKALVVVAWLALGGLWAYTAAAIYGPGRLPARFATHFDAAGQVNGWGEPKMLWLMPLIATGAVALMTVVSRFPQAFNYPMRITRAMRPQLERISLNMIAWLEAELVCLFLAVQGVIIRSAREGQNRLSPWLLPCVLLVVFATIGWHFAALLRVGRTGARG